MIKKISKLTYFLKEWYKSNLAKIFLLVAIHTAVYLLTQLPYLNIINLFFPTVIYSVDVVAVILLFKPSKRSILYSSLILFIASIPFEILGANSLNEIIGIIIYILLSIYLIKFIFEKNKT